MDNKQDSQNFSDDSIRRFLLGQLPAGEQSLFEEQLFTNGELEARVRLAEFELADDYAFKRLTQSESESFRENYLLTADRTQKLKVSQAIRDRFMEPVSETKPAVYQRLWPLLDLRRPAWRYSFAAVLLIMILATVFLVTKEPHFAIRLIPGRFRPRPQATATPETLHHVATPSSPAHVEESPPVTPHESPLMVALSSTTSWDQSSVITLPAGENAVVRFQLSIKEGTQGVYRADLFTASGEPVFSVESLKPFRAQPSSIDFEVPASALKSGAYQIKLARTDEASRQETSQYYFRVQ